MKPYCAYCKKSVEELVRQTGGNIINHFCLERAKLTEEFNQILENYYSDPKDPPKKKGLFKYLKA